MSNSNLLVAHQLDTKWRSDDIRSTEDADFSSLCLSKPILQGLKNAGFIKPSPIQLRAIPLGKVGLDLIVQAKSGTGKTCVFTVIALHSLILKTKSPQILIIAPTREIAFQICDVVKKIGSEFKDLACHTFIGGLALENDKRKLLSCHIAVGTPGRLKQLIEKKYLRPHSIRLLVLDEADKLMLSNIRNDIDWIYSQLPSNKQVVTCSATYPEDLATWIQQYMRNPMCVRLDIDKPALLGLMQYYEKIPYHPQPHVIHNLKEKFLYKLFESVTFSQCLIFFNYQNQASILWDRLKAQGWPVEFICGTQDQLQRLKVMNQLKTFQCRILITTDLTARGIDAENVDLVINYEPPWDTETYLHRIGRAGRFGSYGISITLASEGKELDRLIYIKSQAHLDIYKFPVSYVNLWQYIPEQNDMLEYFAFFQSLCPETSTQTLVDENTTISKEDPNLSSQVHCNKDSLEAGNESSHAHSMASLVGNIRSEDFPILSSSSIELKEQDLGNTSLAENDLDNYMPNTKASKNINENNACPQDIIMNDLETSASQENIFEKSPKTPENDEIIFEECNPPYNPEKITLASDYDNRPEPEHAEVSLKNTLEHEKNMTDENSLHDQSKNILDSVLLYDTDKHFPNEIQSKEKVNSSDNIHSIECIKDVSECASSNVSKFDKHPKNNLLNEYDEISCKNLATNKQDEKNISDNESSIPYKLGISGKIANDVYIEYIHKNKKLECHDKIISGPFSEKTTNKESDDYDQEKETLNFSENDDSIKAKAKNVPFHEAPDFNTALDDLDLHKKNPTTEPPFKAEDIHDCNEKLSHLTNFDLSYLKPDKKMQTCIKNSYSKLLEDLKLFLEEPKEMLPNSDFLKEPSYNQNQLHLISECLVQNQKKFKSLYDFTNKIVNIPENDLKELPTSEEGETQEGSVLSESQLNELKTEEGNLKNNLDNYENEKMNISNLEDTEANNLQNLALSKNTIPSSNSPKDGNKKFHSANVCKYSSEELHSYNQVRSYLYNSGKVIHLPRTKLKFNKEFVNLGMAKLSSSAESLSTVKSDASIQDLIFVKDNAPPLRQEANFSRQTHNPISDIDKVTTISNRDTFISLEQENEHEIHKDESFEDDSSSELETSTDEAEQINTCVKSNEVFPKRKYHSKHSLPSPPPPPQANGYLAYLHPFPTQDTPRYKSPKCSSISCKSHCYSLPWSMFHGHAPPSFPPNHICFPYLHSFYPPPPSFTAHFSHSANCNAKGGWGSCNHAPACHKHSCPHKHISSMPSITRYCQLFNQYQQHFSKMMQWYKAYQASCYHHQDC